MNVMAIIASNGVVTFEVNGAVGTKCDALTKPLIDAMTSGDYAKSLKPEYYDEPNKVREMQGWQG